MAKGRFFGRSCNEHTLLLTAANMGLASYLAWPGVEARERRIAVVAENAAAYLNARKLNVLTE